MDFRLWLSLWWFFSFLLIFITFKPTSFDRSIYFELNGADGSAFVRYIPQAVSSLLLVEYAHWCSFLWNTALHPFQIHDWTRRLDKYILLWGCSRAYFMIFPGWTVSSCEHWRWLQLANFFGIKACCAEGKKSKGYYLPHSYVLHCYGLRSLARRRPCGRSHEIRVGSWISESKINQKRMERENKETKGRACGNLGWDYHALARSFLFLPLLFHLPPRCTAAALGTSLALGVDMSVGFGRENQIHGNVSRQWSRNWEG